MTATTPSAPEYGIQQAAEAMYPPTVQAVRHLLGFLQWRFSLLPRGAYHWEPADESSPEGMTSSSEIYISGDTPLPTRAVGDRPAITVLRSQLQFQGSGLGDTLYHNWQTGGKTYQDLLPTTIAVNVLSRFALVAERLAWFVHDQIFTLREEIIRREKCIVYLGQRATLTPPSPAGALVDSVESDWIAVCLYLPVFLQHRTSFIPINVPTVNKIAVVARQDSAVRDKG